MAELIDSTTLVLMLSFGTIGFGGVVLVAGSRHDLAGRFWAAGFLFAGTGLLLLLLRGGIPDLVSIQLGNTVVLVGIGFMLQALVVHAQRPRMGYAVALWLAGGVALFNIAASPLLSAPLPVRVCIIAALIALSQFLALAILAPMRHPQGRLLDVLRVSHAALGLAFAARFGYVLTVWLGAGDGRTDAVVGPDVADAIFYLAAVFLASIQAPTFMLLKKEQAESDAFEARKQLADEAASRWAEQRLQAARVDDARAGTIEHFARGIAHDANNVLGVLQLGYRQVRDQIKRRRRVSVDALRVMDTALDQARVITSGLMVLGGREPPPLGDICVADVVDEVASVLEATRPANVRLRVSAESGLYAYTHRGFLASAIFNLAMNACEAMPRGGELVLATRHCVEPPRGLISIGSELSPPLIDIAVRDEGDGIDEAALDRLFEPMFSTKEHQDGHGYGLYMVQGVIQRTGAGLVVESRPQQGTTMHLLLKEVKRS